MVYHIFSIKDRAIDAFLRPFYAVHRNQAVRIFTDEINNNQSDMFKHNIDYDLYYLGTWDDQTAQTNQTTTPELIIRGQDAKERG